MSSHSRYDDRRYSSSSRRDSSQSSRRRDRDSYRRSSPGPSRGRSPPPPVRPRDDNELPVEFGRPMEPTSNEDENTVLKRMKTAFKHSPLLAISESIFQKKKIKIWTRNFKEVRGICTGYVVAFDKHWNLILSDVEEVYIKPKKAKTPFLLDVENGEDLPELPPKVPREKKTKTPEEEAAKKKAEEEATKPKKAKRKKGRKINKRHLKQLFVRGDNIVMLSVLDGGKEADSQEPEN
ncbi:unnamed protein product [Larinioides sclopetarius]|uniref:Sm domain-containing protein n=1 Tax=Larinioides sclopetarius TaxID=280406 RepID=A0AAV2AV62_9ARAC